jgi:hypothetical protein
MGTNFILKGALLFELWTHRPYEKAWDTAAAETARQWVAEERAQTSGDDHASAHGARTDERKKEM